MARLKNFFSEDLSEIIGAYFDGEKIFVVRLTENFEAVEVDADGAEPELLAEKISLVCAQKNWKTSAAGFCLREDDAVIYQSEISNLPAKEISAYVKSWAMAQRGKDAAFSFTKVGEELWMETLPGTRLEEFRAAFKKFNLNLRALSVMPADLLTKGTPLDKTKFITEVVREKKSPNFLSGGGVWNWKKISLAAAAIFLIGQIIFSAKIFFDYRAAKNELDAAKISVEEWSTELALKKNLDADIDELHKLNALAAQTDLETNFNLLINLGKISGVDVRLTKIRAEKNFLELEGLTDKPDAVKNYLARVKSSVVQSARLENSAERDDGEFVFVIRADFK